MNIQRFACSMMIALALGCVVAPAQAAMFTNGDFESGSTGWTKIGTHGGFTNNAGRAHEGSWAVGLNGGNNTPDVTISQSFDTETGQLYLLAFYLAKYAAGSGEARLDVDVFDGGDFTGTNLLSTQASESVGHSEPLSAFYSLYKFTFVAQGTTTTLRFVDTSTNDGLAFDTYLDTVSVAAIPTPAALPAGLCLLGGLLMRRR
ncbi:DUF642 domain-containing protein [Planctomycetales bacterium ZRK34]|nr:DUF642 domain-containing protein [Planctomycetales bacterium ZRK34]